MSLRRLLWTLLGCADDPRPPGSAAAFWPSASAACVPVWRGEGDRSRLDPHFINVLGPPPDDGRQPGEFQLEDR